MGILSIRGTRDPGLVVPIEDPMAILQKGYSVTIVLAVLTFGVVSNLSIQMLTKYVSLVPNDDLSLELPFPLVFSIWCTG